MQRAAATIRAVQEMGTRMGHREHCVSQARNCVFGAVDL